MRNFKITIKMAAFNLHFNLVELAGNEQSGKMARKTKRTYGFKNSLKGKLRL